jgi:uncharacterized FlaG/YvyC family protein
MNNQINPLADPVAISGPSVPTQTASAAQTADEQPTGSSIAAPQKSQLEDALQKSNLKANIVMESPGVMVVRFVTPDTGKVVFQLPAQAVIDLVASFTQAAAASRPQNPGAVIDQRV